MQVINVHPILVHFPIALLSLYSFLELVQMIPFLMKFFQEKYWFYIKVVLVIIGSLATLPTMLAGLIASSEFAYMQRVINIHEIFAITTSFIFLFLAVLYSALWGKNRVKNSKFAFVLSLQKIIFRYHGEKILAGIGLVIVSVTGALGGIIAFGPDTDPFAKFIFTLFFH